MYTMFKQSKFREAGKDRFRSLPPELYLLVLEQLNTRDHTATNSLTILNLACCARLHFQLITFWTARRAQRDIDLIKSFGEGLLISDNPEGSPKYISIFCKRLAGICAICNNR